MEDNCRNQIDVIVDLETILIESGLKYHMWFNPNTNEYNIKIANYAAKKEIK